MRPQCVAALLLGAAMALSALFLLKPFAAHRARAGAPPPPGPPGDAFAGELASPRSRSRRPLALVFFSANKLIHK